MNRIARTRRSTVLAMGVLVAMGLIAAGLLGGCVQIGGKQPLVAINGGGRPRPDPANIPAGGEHATCREEVKKALARIEKLEKDLADCQADRRKDKDRWEADKKKLERERDAYKDQVDKLRG